VFGSIGCRVQHQHVVDPPIEETGDPEVVAAGVSQVGSRCHDLCAPPDTLSWPVVVGTFGCVVDDDDLEVELAGHLQGVKTGPGISWMSVVEHDHAGAGVPDHRSHFPSVKCSPPTGIRSRCRRP
jgi:hypothetical protein